MISSSQPIVPANLIDLARLNAPPSHVCVCGVQLHNVCGLLVDGAGQTACPSGPAHSPRIAPSPIGGWLR